MKNILLILCVMIFFSGCFSSPNFMGAEKYTTGYFYTTRWYLKHNYNKRDIPTGTAFYGASADRIKHKFDVKYYELTPNGRDDIEIPKKDIWTVKHNGKRFTEQNDDNLFIYKKQGNNYNMHIDHFGNKNTVENGKYAIKECYSDSWCKLYPNYWKIDLYIKQSILDKPLSDE